MAAIAEHIRANDLVRALELLERHEPSLSREDLGELLAWAAARGSAELMSRLVGAGADPNARSSFQDLGWAPLFYAVENGEPDAVEWLLAHGADPNARAADGSSPLHLAIDWEAITAHEWDSEPRAGMSAVLLAAGADPSAADRRGVTPLDVAVELHHAAAERLLREKS